jgi:hypothetical protein
MLQYSVQRKLVMCDAASAPQCTTADGWLVLVRLVWFCVAGCVQEYVAALLVYEKQAKELQQQLAASEARRLAAEGAASPTSPVAATASTPFPPSYHEHLHNNPEIRQCKEWARSGTCLYVAARVFRLVLFGCFGLFGMFGMVLLFLFLFFLSLVRLAVTLLDSCLCCKASSC